MKDNKNNREHEVEFINSNNGISILLENINQPDKYAQKKRLKEYYKKLLEINELPIEQIELKAKIEHFFKDDITRYKKLFKEDMEELNICFKNKAYKATLILAGSILEAFLIDWLSENDGIDYFKKPYIIKEKDENGKIKEREVDSLYVYIEQIKEIEKPKWMTSSKNAHFIRKQRNSVHVKLCLKENIGINEKTCKQVIEYLTEIINTRIKNKNKGI